MKKISVAVLLTTSIFAGSTIAADNSPGSTIDGAMAGHTGKGTSANGSGKGSSANGSGKGSSANGSGTSADNRGISGSNIGK